MNYLIHASISSSFLSAPAVATTSRNLTNVMVVEAQYADPVSLVQFPNVVATAGALKKLEEMLA